MSDYLMQTYARQPVVFTHGEGAWLVDETGEHYLDALSGIAVNGLGHAHPRLTRALCEQAGKLIHVSNLFRVREQEALAEKLCQLSGMDRAFFCNSGAEANEAAIKLARLYGHNKGIDSPHIIVMEKSFHGRTLATLTATGNRKVQAGFEPLVQGFLRVPYDDLTAVEQIAAHNKSVVAILVEPVQGEGGVHVPDAAYLAGLRKICDANDWLLMLDEVQTGIGRTGQWFAFQHTGILPDVVSLAKGLGSGVPVGASLARGAAAEVFTAGKHGTTFGGNPLACTAALTTLQTMVDDNLLARAAALGERIRAGMKAALQGVGGIRDIRGQGLMIGIELDRPCSELVAIARDQEKLILNVTADSVIRLLPPLILSDAEADLLVEKLARIVRTFLD
jgi:acetylornithine aminotransferase